MALVLWRKPAAVQIINIHKWVQNQAESTLFIKEDELVGIEHKKLANIDGMAFE